MLTPRYHPMRPHPAQLAWVASTARFNVVPAGRRSGKTEILKRKVIKHSLTPNEWPDPRYFLGAPTREQAKRIFWADIKAMIPTSLLAGPPRESDLSITLVTGAQIWVIGLDKPERFEGTPWNGGGLDEYANMRSKVWGENIRPALSDRRGWCDFIGVPEGRNHYYEIAQKAQSDETGEWAFFTWISADILDPAEIISAKADLDELTYQQEYEASFLNFTGRAYYRFDRNQHCEKLQYSPNQPLIIMFDFNISPGVLVIAQEQKLPVGNLGTAIIGEIYIPRNSNTVRICERFKSDYGHHTGEIFCYGDATGGQKGSAKVAGSDWELIKDSLTPHFRGRIKYRVPSQNPPERTRVNSLNTRIMSGDGTIRLMIDPSKAPKTVNDLEGVRVIEGGAGEIDKTSDPKLTHLSDALGYYVNHRFPISGNVQTGYIPV